MSTHHSCQIITNSVFVSAFPRSPEAQNSFPRGRFFLCIPRLNTDLTSCTTLTTSMTQLANHQWLPHNFIQSSVAQQPPIMNSLPWMFPPIPNPLQYPSTARLPHSPFSFPYPHFTSIAPSLRLPHRPFTPNSQIPPMLLLRLYSLYMSPYSLCLRPLMQPWLPPSVSSSSPYTFLGSRCLNRAITPSQPPPTPLTNPVHHLPPFLKLLVFSSLPLTSSQLCLSVSLPSFPFKLIIQRRNQYIAVISVHLTPSTSNHLTYHTRLPMLRKIPITSAFTP
jgi:hypothetical protein